MKVSLKFFSIVFSTSLICLRVFAQCTLPGRTTIEPTQDEYNGRCRAGAFIYGCLWFLHTDYGSFENENNRNSVIALLDQAFDYIVIDNDLNKAKEKINSSIGQISNNMIAGVSKDIYLILLYGAIFMLNNADENTTIAEAIQVLYNEAGKYTIATSSVDQFVNGSEPSLDERRNRLFHPCDPGHQHSAGHEIFTCFPDWLLAKIFE